MSHILEHLEEPEKAISEAYNVLKKSGKLIAITPNRYSKSSYLDPTHKQHFTRATFKKLFHYFSDVRLVGEEGCLIPLKGNTRLWGKLVAKIFPSLAKDFKIIAKK